MTVSLLIAFVAGRSEESSGVGLEFRDPFVDPVPAIVPAPDFSDHKLPVDRATWHDHRPQVPELGPVSSGNTGQRHHLVLINDHGPALISGPEQRATGDVP